MTSDRYDVKYLIISHLIISPIIDAIIIIMLKIAIFEILANFDTMFRDEDVEIAKKTEDMLKIIVSAS